MASAELPFDAALRRKLRQKLGTRTSRRMGTNRAGQLKPRQKLAHEILKWAEDQANARRAGDLARQPRR